MTSIRRVPEPTYPRFPKAEFVERIRKTRQGMKADGIDVLLVSERENVVYLTGLATPEWVQKGTVVAAVMIAADSDEPVMVLPDFFFGMAEKSTWVNDFILHRKSHSNQLDFANLLASTIRERGWADSRIGYEAGTETLLGMPQDLWELLRNELSSAAWVDGRNAIWGARMIKSKAEIECLRRSAVANTRATEQLRDHARPGMNELALAAYLRRAMIQDDASEQDRMWVVMRAGKERYSMAGCSPGDNRIKQGDLLVIDQGIMLDNYAADTARVMSVGKPSELHASVYSKVVEARRRALSHLKAGVPASTIYQAVRSFYDEAGFPVHIDMVGHGIGLDPHEPPMLAANNDTPLEENMVVCIEPWVTLPDDQGVLTCEDTFLVKADGWEQLSLANADEMWVING